MPSVSANMGLRVWTDNDDTFESDQLASNFMKLDFHDHSPGRGLQVPTEGFKDASITSAKLSNAATLKACGSFSAYRNGALSAVASTSEIIFDTEEWDFSNWYDLGNGRFTPQVAGYYRASSTVTISTDLAANGYFELSLAKNGTSVKWGNRHAQPAANPSGIDFRVSVTGLIACNGTTDYISIKTGSSVAVDLVVNSQLCYFQGELVGRS